MKFWEGSYVINTWTLTSNPFMHNIHDTILERFIKLLKWINKWRAECNINGLRNEHREILSTNRWKLRYINIIILDKKQDINEKEFLKTKLKMTTKRNTIWVTVHGSISKKSSVYEILTWLFVIYYLSNCQQWLEALSESPRVLPMSIYSANFFAVFL